MKRMNALRKSVLLALALPVLSFGCAVAHQTVRFETIPDKADLYINGIPQGKAPVTANLVTDAFANIGQTHAIVAKMDGYEDKKLVLESPSRWFNNTKPFPETITLKLRKIRSDAYSEEKPKQQADENALPLTQLPQSVEPF
jgi:hypothetical protein